MYDVVLFLQADNEYVYTAAYKIKTNDYSIFEFIQPIPEEHSQGSILTLIEISTSYIDKTYHIAASEYKIITNGDGTKFLANDGSYKEINNVFIIDDNIITTMGDNNPIDEQNYNFIINAIKENKILIYKNNAQNYISSSYLSDGDTFADIRFYGLQEPIAVTDSQFQTIDVVTIHLDKTTLTSKVRFFDFDFKNDILTKTNTTEYTPTQPYNPATKKYVDDNSNKYIYNSLDGYELYESEDVTDPTLINRIFDIVNECTQVSNNKTIKVIDYYNAVYSVGDVYWKDNNTLRVIYRDFNNYNNIRYIDITRHDNANSTINFNGYVQRILTESEYQALGDTVNSDGVLYFITED